MIGLPDGYDLWKTRSEAEGDEPELLEVPAAGQICEHCEEAILGPGGRCLLYAGAPCHEDCFWGAWDDLGEADPDPLYWSHSS